MHILPYLCWVCVGQVNSDHSGSKSPVREVHHLGLLKDRKSTKNVVARRIDIKPWRTTQLRSKKSSRPAQTHALTLSFSHSILVTFPHLPCLVELQLQVTAQKPILHIWTCLNNYENSWSLWPNIRVLRLQQQYICTYSTWSDWIRWQVFLEDRTTIYKCKLSKMLYRNVHPFLGMGHSLALYYFDTANISTCQ